MKRSWFFLLVIALVLILSVPLWALENAVITGDGVNIREAPTRSSKSLGSANKGARIEVVANSGVSETIESYLNFWYVVQYQGKKGYVFGRYITLDEGVSVPVGETPEGQTPTAPTTIRPEDVIGDWAMLSSYPAIVYSFEPGGFAQYFVFSWDVDLAGERVKRKYLTVDLVRGEYTVEGQTIRVTWFWGDRHESVFTAQKGAAGMTLAIDGVSILPSQHTPVPGGTTIEDIVINTEPDL